MSEECRDGEELSLAAIPIKRETLRKARLELQDLPEAFFSEVEAEVEVVSTEAVREREEEPLQLPQGRISEEVEQASKPRTPAFHQPKVEKGSSINRKALDSTNRGRKPSSRRFVRGILHPSPFAVALAAFFAIAVRLVMLGAILLGTLILLEKVEPQLAWFLLLLPVVALCHFATVGRARCRVCGQKEFVPSGALKHVKTHRFLFFGPIVTTALHLLLFKWFHCMFCGTAVRIRK